MPNHILPTLRLHLDFLGAALSAEGWASSTQHIMAASKLLDLEAFQQRPPDGVQGDQAAMEAYLTSPCPIEVSERQREALKACVGHFIKAGKVRPNRYLPILLDVLGLSD